MPEVLLVDEQDNFLGTYDKQLAHVEGKLHRAFSVYVINKDKQIMLQQRALSKYHSPGLFANTCCSHQYMGEDNEVAAHRRLQEEMGFATELTKVTEFVYQVAVPPELTEHEYLHVYFGTYTDQIPEPHPDEVASWKRVSFDQMDAWVDDKEVSLAPWTAMTWKKCRPLFLDFYQIMY